MHTHTHTHTHTHIHEHTHTYTHTHTQLMSNTAISNKYGILEHSLYGVTVDKWFYYHSDYYE